MSCNIKNLNRIASFMLVSLALSAPTLARSFNIGNENYIADASVGAFTAPPGFTEVIAKYAAPQFPIGEVKPVIETPNISMYAAPDVPIYYVQPGNTITVPAPIVSMYAAVEMPINPVPNPAPIMSMYAAPEIPIREVNPDIVKPLENDINNSIEKINKDSKMHNANIDNLINSSKINSLKTGGQIANFNNNTTMNTINPAKAAKILYEKDGSIRILGPVSYSDIKKER